MTAMYKMRSDIARDLHDEIGSTLTSISVLSKISGQQIEKDHLKVKGMINEISEQSLQIQQNMSDIVWAINPENDKLQNMLVRMREYVAQTLEPKNINTLFSVDEPAVKETLTMLICGGKSSHSQSKLRENFNHSHLTYPHHCVVVKAIGWG